MYSGPQVCGADDCPRLSLIGKDSPHVEVCTKEALGISRSDRSPRDSVAGLWLQLVSQALLSPLFFVSKNFIIFGVDITLNNALRMKSEEQPQDIVDIEESLSHSSYQPPTQTEGADEDVHVSGMYRSWFIEYASYVILDRSVPNIYDGLKPVQRRILHSMKRLDDGRYNKVANIVGHTMQFHPHGDASIGDALVQLGQKDLLIDCQGNWGNVLTGDNAAAPRYIEARLSKFALEVLFNPKTTNWKPSYDGRNKEPISLPVKFPLLLAQGVEGIAVALSSKVMPHNFVELIDACIAHYRGEPFTLYPDFPSGGYVDVAKYNDGERSGSIKVRAKISKLDSKTLVIGDLPYGKTATTVVESILKANEKGKIKIRKVDDFTADKVEIRVQLQPGVSSDKAIDALYAFTDCETSISPNCCVIYDDKPMFMNVSDLLRHSADHTKGLLRWELEIERGELLESLFFASLERIFIEERIYKDMGFEQAKDMDDAVAHIDSRLEPFKERFVREITREDILRLMEIKMGRILKFNTDKADELIARYKADIETIDHHLAHLIDYAIAWFETLKARYGKKFPRRTEIRNFDTIEAAKVVEANEKLYVNYDEGFIGTGLKQHEYVCNCSDIDDIIIFYKDGKFKMVKVADKLFVGKNIKHVDVFKRNDKRTIYNVAYRDGKNGSTFVKRFFVTSIVRDKEYDVTKGTSGSRMLYFSANPNGEAETIRVVLKQRLRQRVTSFEHDFANLPIKGRGTMGNLLTKADIQTITCKTKGRSTLGGLKVWFDPDVLRLNNEGRGDYLGEFQGDDLILLIDNRGRYKTTSFEVGNHYEAGILRIEKHDRSKVWTLALYDADQGYAYLKRFALEPTSRDNFHPLLGENDRSTILLLTDTAYPNLQVTFGGDDAFRMPLQLDAEEFIQPKSFKAKGKRIATFEVAEVTELEPLRFPPVEPDLSDDEVDEVQEVDLFTATDAAEE